MRIRRSKSKNISVKQWVRTMLPLTVASLYLGQAGVSWGPRQTQGPRAPAHPLSPAYLPGQSSAGGESIRVLRLRGRPSWRRVVAPRRGPRIPAATGTGYEEAVKCGLSHIIVEDHRELVASFT